MPNLDQDREDFYLEFDLKQERKYPSKKVPVAHQSEAIKKLNSWFDDNNDQKHGGILTLPTGAGKTYVAVKFLCSPYGPLSKGFKVLWLAQTHHLLEQAYYTFAYKDISLGREIASISEQRNSLHIRLVSGIQEHRNVCEINRKDDVAIGTIQTIQKAYFDSKQTGLQDFLVASCGELIVIFDEAHHSPAPSYRKLITDLQDHYPNMYLLGLTATPTYTDEKKEGWLKILYPQKIIFQVSPQQLMADKILAKPVFQKCSTEIVPQFDDREYQKWVNTYKDLPEEIISSLADNRERNTLIVETYVKNKDKFGKTIIFADRWFQCESLREMLRNRNIRADAIYSHLDASSGSIEERNKRTKDENKIVLEKFRNKELDVLINVKMLTEGTDIPDVQTVFLTRQTTSKILLTQMVGRALRGPKFGGTEEANIVSFTDQWEQMINWAEYEQLKDGLADDSLAEYGNSPPLSLISIELVRKLIRQMDSGINVNPMPFLTLVPIGWYRTEYITQIEGIEDTETINQLNMVFENSEEGYRKFIELIRDKDLSYFENETVDLDKYREKILYWGEKSFNVESIEDINIFHNLLNITRHMAQNNKTPPVFFPFKDRNNYNLDEFAERLIDQNLSLSIVDELLYKEYNRIDRYWKTIYYHYDLFKSQYDACNNRVLKLRRSYNETEEVENYIQPKTEPQQLKEPYKYLKAEVMRRDKKCQCCGEDDLIELQIDHKVSVYHGVDNSLNNLQVLCKTCNQIKSSSNIDFLSHATPLLKAPATFIFLPEPKKYKIRKKWYEWMVRNINFFYQCSAIENIGSLPGTNFIIWVVTLYEGNDPDWFQPFLSDFITSYNYGRMKCKADQCQEIIIEKHSSNEKE